MSSTFNIGLKVLRKQLEEQNTLGWYKAKLTKEMFKGIEVDAFLWVEEFLTKYHKLPTLDTAMQHYPDLAEVDCPENTLYYLDLIENRFVYSTINKANIDSQNVLKEDKNDTVKAENVLRNALDTITKQRYKNKILNVGQDAPALVLADYHKVNKKDVKIQFGWETMDDMSGGAMGGDVISTVGRPASGKAQPLSSQVLTTTGFKTMGSIKIGDKLASVDGEESEVLAIYPQGEQDVYEITFQDGRTARATGDHLWEIKHRHWETSKVETTLDICNRLQKVRYQKRLSIPLYTGEFGTDSKLELDPYLLGALIGDGGLTYGVRFSTKDDHILEKIRAAVIRYGCTVNYLSNYDYSICKIGGSKNPIEKILNTLGLMGCKSEAKEIPKHYLTASKPQRLELLKGLMDTDGTACKAGGVSYSTSSKVLATQVQELVRGLGGKATVNLKKTNHLDNYIVHIVLKDRAEAFSLPRKVERVSAPRTTHINHQLTIVSVKLVGREECQCIKVSHPRRLYITDNYVVTHNTYLQLAMALKNWRAKNNVLFASMEMNHLAISQRVAAMYANTGATQLKLSAYSSSTYNRFKEGLQGMKKEESGFYVVDGNLAAYADDLYMLAAYLDCSAIYIDGAYLMRHKNDRLDRYTRVAENAELMKRYSTDLDIPTFASWQFNRTAGAKGKGKFKGEKAGLEDIGYSDAIGQISTIVMGMHQEEGIETMQSRSVEIMKGRNGETGNFKIHWDFINMNFNEITEEEESEINNDLLKYI